MAVEGTLSEFQEVETGEAFTVQNPQLLKVELSQTSVMARSGAMVAYQGEVHFEHKGGGAARLLKKAATGEGLRLMQASGSGEVFLADRARMVHVVRLADEGVTVSGDRILAFEDSIDWDVRRVKGLTGMLSAGLFNIELQGSGLVAIATDGQPVLLEVGDAPTAADPQAAVAWSSGVVPEFKADVSLKSFVGLGSGESVQMLLSGSGWVLVQPSEGFPIQQASSG